MSSPFRPIGEALGFLTVAGGATVPSPASMRWFPLVGALIGALMAGVWWATDHVLSALVTAVVVIAADAAVTGMLHLDGLADAADGLLPHADRSRRLEIMSTPDVGAFAVAAMILTLALRISSIASMTIDTTAVMGLVVLWSTSRASMGAIMRAIPYARSSGLASVFARPSSTLPAGLVIAIGALMAVAATQPARQVLRLSVALLASAVAAFGVAVLARRRLGGYTGDVLGAAGVVAETVGMVVLSAHW